MLCAFHESSKFSRNLNFLANNLLHSGKELGRMSSFEENTHFAFLQTLAKRTITHCTMRVAKIACFLVGSTDALSNLLVGIGASTDIGTNGSVVFLIQVVNTSEVRRVAHVHRICNGLNGRTRIVFACLQIIVEDVVGIVCGNETLHRKSHTLAKES